MDRRAFIKAMAGLAALTGVGLRNAKGFIPIAHRLNQVPSPFMHLRTWFLPVRWSWSQRPQLKYPPITVGG